MPVADHGTQSVARSHDAGIRNTAGTELENCILLDLRWQIQRYGRFTAGVICHTSSPVSQFPETRAGFKNSGRNGAAQTTCE